MENNRASKTNLNTLNVIHITWTTFMEVPGYVHIHILKYRDIYTYLYTYTYRVGDSLCWLRLGWLNQVSAYEAGALCSDQIVLWRALYACARAHVYHRLPDGAGTNGDFTEVPQITLMNFHGNMLANYENIWQHMTKCAHWNQAYGNMYGQLSN